MSSVHEEDAFFPLANQSESRSAMRFSRLGSHRPLEWIIDGGVVARWNRFHL